MKKLYLILIILLINSYLVVSQTKIGGTAKIGGKVNVGNAGSGGGDIVNDTFTQGSDVNLSSHTGEIGATWTLHTSYSGIITVDSTLDRIYLTSASAAAYHASGNPSSSTYCTESDFRRLSVLANNVSIIIGFDTATDTGILLRLNDNGTSTQWEVFDRNNGSNGAVTSSSTSVPSAGGSAVTSRICRNGTSITVFHNGVQDTTLNFTTAITAIGKGGIRASGTASSTTGIHLDNFRVF